MRDECPGVYSWTQWSSDKFRSKKRHSMNRESEEQGFCYKQEDKSVITELK